jgi:hypothetical protein
LSAFFNLFSPDCLSFFKIWVTGFGTQVLDTAGGDKLETVLSAFGVDPDGQIQCVFSSCIFKATWMFAGRAQHPGKEEEGRREGGSWVCPQRLGLCDPPVLS